MLKSLSNDFTVKGRMTVKMGQTIFVWPWLIPIILMCLPYHPVVYPTEHSTYAMIFGFFVGTASQMVIQTQHIQWIGQGGGIQLLYIMICVIGLTIFDFKWELCVWFYIAFKL